ncbi:MAG: TIGR04282 family arsenosugar biosynthesis glycosyltransferase [Planktotalea sp.]|jgi:rSAM/selenodomain-associated transferase 1|uniref:TIGR04282 family arsenosugar biosynthesis glycosyltransferase n=1 Tax=Planktotalea sp. TaxID=2029877 RepID=UPI002612799F|nr:TIGR04282 family arsenosugar biosynthesis glycosyltransferase [Planktotalea sp.]MDG1083316.1 TIGR04282 family arsenosugar biosynthesis glycosyltransferase [Planktotalea sp.]
MRAKLVVMVKEPHPGRVKTRLGRDIGLTASAWWFRHQVGALLRRIEDPRWDTILAVAPDVEGLTSRIWPAHLPRVAQGRGDLGHRMSRLLRGLPNGLVCIIGADIPDITRPRIAEAFNALGNHEAVFGPAPDGGYWLIGMKRARPPRADILTDVRWSSEHALTDSARSLGDVSIAYVATLRDVDTVDDLIAM